MTSSSAPSGSGRPTGSDQSSAEGAVALAASLCAERGVRLTAIRRQVLELLYEMDAPRGAYDLVQALQEKVGRNIAPPTVYRALEFLIEQGLAAKIESRNAYAPCTHPERPDDCLFFICSDCGGMSEIEDPGVGQQLQRSAAGLGFKVSRRVVEVQGTCASCSEAKPA
ncbi:MAG: transcriptional repressor [Pseudomonadota bacterium]